MSRFTPKTERILRRAGWHPGRRIDLVPLEALARDGWPVLAAARAFYEEFGKLSLHPHEGSVWRRLLGLQTRPRSAAVHLTPERWVNEDLAAEQGGADLRPIVPCTPIGATWDGDCVLLMDDAGRVHEWLHSSVPVGPSRWLVAETGDRALETLCAGAPRPSLKE